MAGSCNTSPLTSALQILQEHPSRRKEGQLQLLASYMSNIRFFQELTERTDSDAVKTACKYLTHESWRRGEILFRKGDTGTKFYIVLSGTVGIYVKTSVNQEVVCEDTGVKVVKSVLELQEVKELHPGGTFGELALITNNLRAATVQCKTECHLAVLEKADYIRILGRLEQQKLEELVEFLQSLPLFKGWGKLATQRISYYFTPTKFIRKQCVYRSRDPATHVYIIKSGEFEFSKDITKSMESIKLPKFGSKQLFHKYQVTLLGKGEVFGDREILEGTPRLYTCSCLSSGTLLIISKEVPLTQDFEGRILIDEDRAKLIKTHLAKANIRESRVQKVISLNSGGSMSHTQSPAQSQAGVTMVGSSSAVVVAAKPMLQRSPTTVSFSDTASVTGPVAYRKTSLESWRQILKKFNKKTHKIVPSNSLLPRLPMNPAFPRRSDIHLTLPNPRFSYIEDSKVHKSMMVSPNESSVASGDRSRDITGISDTEENASGGEGGMLKAEKGLGKTKMGLIRRSLAY